MATQSDGELTDAGQIDATPRFPYDDRPVHPAAEEERPLESLAGRGQTEGTPMGLGQGLGWTILALAGAVILLILGTYVVSLFR